MTTTFNFRGPNDPHLGASFIPTGSNVPANGIFLPAANTVGIASNSAERIRISPNGNVGIGTSSPGSALQVQGLITGTAVTQSNTDTTAGRLMKVGDFGLGLPRDGSPAAVTNWNTNTYKGFFRSADSGNTGTPPGVVGFLTGMELGYASSTGTQLAFAISGTAPQAWMRGSPSGAGFGDWVRFFHNKNILGAVSQSSGVPTGAVIERGSNSNGEFVRYADGTQICTRSIELTLDLTGSSPIFYSDTGPHSFPANFIDTTSTIPSIHPLVSEPVTQGGIAVWIVGRGFGYSVSSWSFTVASTTPGNITKRYGLIAIGRWY